MVAVVVPRVLTAVERDPADLLRIVVLFRCTTARLAFAVMQVCNGYNALLQANPTQVQGMHWVCLPLCSICLWHGGVFLHPVLTGSCETSQSALTHCSQGHLGVESCDA